MNLDVQPSESQPILRFKDAFTIQSTEWFFKKCNFMLYCLALKHL